MRSVLFIAWTALGIGCSGGETTPAPKPEPEPAPAPAPEPAPAPAPAADDVSKDTDISGMSEADRNAFLMKLGEKVYKTGDGGLACITCHQENGQGMPGAFPPLVGQKDFMGDCKNHAKLILNGLQGEIEINGQKFNGVMVPQAAALNDLQIAAAISYVRNSWGNDYGHCLPEDVAAMRGQ